MKQIILACLILFPLTGVMAQETTRRQTIVNTSGDSIIIRKGDGDVKIKVYEEVTTDGDTKQEEKLFEGVYLNVSIQTAPAYWTPCLLPLKSAIALIRTPVASIWDSAVFPMISTVSVHPTEHH